MSNSRDDTNQVCLVQIPDEVQGDFIVEYELLNGGMNLSSVNLFISKDTVSWNRLGSNTFKIISENQLVVHPSKIITDSADEGNYYFGISYNSTSIDKPMSVYESRVNLKYSYTVMDGGGNDDGSKSEWEISNLAYGLLILSVLVIGGLAVAIKVDSDEIKEYMSGSKQNIYSGLNSGSKKPDGKVGSPRGRRDRSDSDDWDEDVFGDYDDDYLPPEPKRIEYDRMDGFTEVSLRERGRERPTKRRHRKAISDWDDEEEIGWQ